MTKEKQAPVRALSTEISPDALSYDIVMEAPNPLLRPAHSGHLGIVRALIRTGAAEGAFDRELAHDTVETALFFENLAQALRTGYFVFEDARTGALTCSAVPAYLYWPDRNGAVPAGFGMFKRLDDIYELWLTAIEPRMRGHGHGRAMLDALFATPAGRLAFVVRVQKLARTTPHMAHLLDVHGFKPIRATPSVLWFVRHDAPAGWAHRIRHAPLVIH